jgi:hypothetical protein
MAVMEDIWAGRQMDTNTINAAPACHYRAQATIDDRPVFGPCSASNSFEPPSVGEISTRLWSAECIQKPHFVGDPCSQNFRTSAPTGMGFQKFAEQTMEPIHPRSATCIPFLHKSVHSRSLSSYSQSPQDRMRRNLARAAAIGLIRTSYHPRMPK